MTGGVVILALVAASRGVPAWREWEGDRVAAAQGVARALADARRITASVGALADSGAARRLRLDALDSLILDGNSPAAAAAALTLAVVEAA